MGVDSILVFLNSTLVLRLKIIQALECAACDLAKSTLCLAAVHRDSLISLLKFQN